MSSFYPLNLAEDPTVSKKEMAEQHSRELQIEQAITMYQDVLKLQKIGSLNEAYHRYGELFKLDIINSHEIEEEDFVKGLQNGGMNTNPDELTFISPNIKLLRYLIYRNRGMLYLEILKNGSIEQLCNSQEKETPEQKFIELAYRLIDDFCISLIYQEADEKLLSTLYDLLYYIGAYRLAKFTLEYTLTGKSESDDILGLIPVDSLIEERYKWVRGILGEFELSKNQWQKLSNDINRINNYYEFLHPLKVEFQSQITKSTNLNSLDVGLTNTMDWSSVIDAINSEIQIHQDKSIEIPRSKSKYQDLYSYTEHPLERVKFRIVEEKEIVDEGILTIENVDTERSNDNADAQQENLTLIDVNENIDIELLEPDIEIGKDPYEENTSETTAVSSIPTHSMVVDDVHSPMEDLNDEDNSLSMDDERKAMINTDTVIEDLNDMNDSNLEAAEEEHIGSSVSEIANEKDTDNDSKDEVGIEDGFAEGNVKQEEYLNGHISETQKDEIKEETKEGKLKGRNKPQRASRRLAQTEVFDSTPEIILERGFFEETSRFYDTLSEFLVQLNNDKEFKLLNVVDIFLPVGGDTTPNQYITDFIDSLNKWEHPTYTKCLLSNNSTIKTSEDEKVKLLDVLSGFAKTNLDSKAEANEMPKIADYDDENTIKEYLLSLNDTQVHYIELKLKILSRLLGYSEFSGEVICLVTSTVWPRKLFDKVKDWTLQNEHYLPQVLATNVIDIEKTLPLSVSIHEILVDTYLSVQEQISVLLAQSTQKYHKPTINSLSLELVKLKGTLRSWDLFIGNLFNLANNQRIILTEVEIRYKWSSINMQKSSNIHSLDNKYVILKLQELSKMVKEYNKDLHIHLTNYNNIPDINLNNIKGQLTTLSVLSMFSRILSESNSNNPEAINLLKVILKGDTDFAGFEFGEESAVTAEAINAITKFLDNSPIDMKLSLWNILFSYYSSNGKSIEFQLGFEFNLNYLLVYLSSVDYESLNASTRSNTLIKIIGFLSDNLNLFLSIIAKNEWKLPSNQIDDSVFEVLLRYFELFYLFSLHEEAAMISSLKVSVQKKSLASYKCLKNIFVRMTSILLIYYKAFLFEKEGDNIKSRHIISDLISVTHDQLGIRNVCDASDSLFLEMAQEILIELQGDSRQDLAQILFCRYHYSVSIGNFTPKDHGSETQQELDESTTKEISRFILPQCFRTNPILNVPKHDTKGLIEDFYEVIGDPEFDSCAVSATNLAIMDDFLDNTDVTPRFMRDSFHGLLDLEFSPISKNHEIIENGLYYLIGVISYSSYRIRKKSMQTRAVELENIIKFLRNDLIYSTKRVESWYLLGQAYGFLVEDDLIWTADKLTVPERKIQTANLQRKAIICYLMAINGTITSESSRAQSFKPIIGNLMAAFAKEMYSACMLPMDMHAFKAKMHPRFVRRDTTKFDMSPSTSSIPLSLCLKVIQQSLHLGIKANPKDWTNYYYLAKVQRKLKKDPKLVLKTMLEASELAFNQSSPTDRIIEPHYTICSYVYKYYKAKELSFDDAVVILKQDPVIALPEDHIPDDKNHTDINFYRTVVYTLRKVDSYDKKHWHHKPRYRLSKVLFDEFKDSTEAIEQMSSLVSVKANSKTLVSIWKPENERPGKHFYYTYQYAKFFIQLLTFNNDLVNLINMFPRLRRSNSIMVSLYTAWESICSSVCKIIRTSIDVETNFLFTDKFMQTLTYSSFMKNSKVNLEAIQKDGIPRPLEPLVCYLYSLNDMKKFNNGFGPTSFIDDTIVAIFFKIYIYFEKENEPELPIVNGGISNGTVESPGGKYKKIAKRDIFPFVTEILKNSRREIETIIKENPSIFNDFVRSNKERQEKERLELEVRANVPKIEEITDESSSAINRIEVTSRPLTPCNPQPVVVLPSNGNGQIAHYTSFPIMQSIPVNENNVTGSLAAHDSDTGVADEPSIPIILESDEPNSLNLPDNESEINNVAANDEPNNSATEETTKRPATDLMEPEESKRVKKDNSFGN